MSNLILSSCGRYLYDENTGEILEYSPAYVVNRIVELFKENKTFFLECFQALTEVDPLLWDLQEIDDPNIAFAVWGTDSTVKEMIEYFPDLYPLYDDTEISELMKYYPSAVEIWCNLFLA